MEVSKSKFSKLETEIPKQVRDDIDSPYVMFLY